MKEQARAVYRTILNAARRGEYSVTFKRGVPAPLAAMVTMASSNAVYFPTAHLARWAADTPVGRIATTAWLSSLAVTEEGSSLFLGLTLGQQCRAGVAIPPERRAAFSIFCASYGCFAEYRETETIIFPFN